MAESAVRIVVGSVGNLAVQETKFLCGVTREVTFLKDELLRLQAYLKDADRKRRSGNARVDVLVSQIRNAAYEAQNVIEAADYMEKRNRLKMGFMGAISRYARLPCDLATLHKTGVQIRHVRRKLSEIFASAEKLNIDLDHTVLTEVEFPQDYGPMYQNFEDDVVMVGFEDDHKQIVDKLVESNKMLSVVSIVAMGGVGKTTLARKVCTSSRVKRHFDTIAWVTVSQKFKGFDLLKDIMKQIMNIIANMPHLVEVELYKLSALHKFPEIHHFAQSIRSFNLTAYAIEQDPMPVLEKLQSLVVLKLEGYKGQSMSCSTEGFPCM
nr:putative disease resistance protein At1g50180 [Aegilops tauschii subsp. strangulata]